MSPRFLTLADVAETLNISAAQTYALVRSGELRAIKVGGRGQWRVEATELENYINAAYEQTASFLATNRDDRLSQDEARSSK
jgi:excisionase family DNA binding protein